jgi:hypothetical protein
MTTIRITRFHVSAPGKPMFDQSAIAVEIDDEGAGEYVALSMVGTDGEPPRVTIDPKEWPVVRRAINRAFAEIRRNEGDQP